MTVTAEAAEIRLYNADPAHPANRLHAAMFVRVGPDGLEYGHDRVDPLLWQESRHLLSGHSLQAVLNPLIELLNQSDLQLKQLGLRQRAILQRDLWATFDSVSGRVRAPDADQAKLMMALAAGIRRLALNQQELSQIELEAGESYTKALKRNGWIELASEGKHPIAAAHADHFGGRSTSLVLMRLGAKQDTVSYLRSLYEFPEPLLPPRTPGGFQELNPALPQLNPRSQFVFARFANLIRNDGKIVATPIFEVFQMMMLLPDGKWQFGRAEFSRARYFSGARNGLVGISRNDSDFPQLLVTQIDPFEETRRWFKVNVLQNCNSCHLPNIAGVESYARDFQSNLKTPRVDRMIPQLNSVQFELTRAYKESDPNWLRLQKVLFRR